MNRRIAIQADRVHHRNGEMQSFSDRWTELATANGIDAYEVDVEAPDFFESLRECDGFMWRFGYDPLSLQHAKRLLPAIEQAMKIPVFPSWASAWHFEDKIAQYYLISAAGIPTPKTWIWWSRQAALDFCRTARYPLVTKLASGIQSINVRLLQNFNEAADLIHRIFGGGLVSYQPAHNMLHRLLRSRIQGLRLLAGMPLPRGIQHGYFYVQEFLPDNEFDTRVTIIGDRAFAFRRFNRTGDFRASGSGRIEWDPGQIDLDAVRIAFQTARQLNTQSVAIDALRRGHERLITEISYTFASWAVRDCPGHWILNGSPDTGSLAWVEGKLRPEDAIFIDFMSLVERHGRHRIEHFALQDGKSGLRVHGSR